MALWDSFVTDDRRLEARSVAKDMAGWADQLPVIFQNDRLQLDINIAAPDGDPAGCDVVITTKGKQHKTRLRWKTLALATHYTLDCPITGKAVRALYAVGDRVGSRAALGIGYPSRDAPRADQRASRYRRLSLKLNGDGTRKAARAGNRDRLLSQLSGLDVDQMDDRDRRAVLKWRRQNSADEPPMQAALKRALSGYQMIRPAVRLDELATVSALPDLSPRPRASLQRKGRHLMIDLAALLEAEQAFGGRGWVLEYSDGTVVYAERTDSPEGARLRLGWAGEQSGYQEFELAEVDGALQTPCPVTGVPTGALFLRRGRWASAKAQRLS